MGDTKDVTDEVRAVVKQSGIEDGLALVFAPHATGAIIINEYVSDLMKDLRDTLERLIPASNDYDHPANAYSHLRSIFMEPSKVLPVSGSDLELGTWQSIIWVEVDYRPRRREIVVKVIGS
jgi:secondary thiamine-phosphate synthase enzyme